MLKIGLLTIVLGLTTSCQKSDVENCVDADMEAFDESRLKNPQKVSDGSPTRKEYNAQSYWDCLRMAAPKSGD
jgi:hypothetical protein